MFTLKLTASLHLQIDVWKMLEDYFPFEKLQNPCSSSIFFVFAFLGEVSLPETNSKFAPAKIDGWKTRRLPGRGELLVSGCVVFCTLDDRLKATLMMKRNLG